MDLQSTEQSLRSQFLDMQSSTSFRPPSVPATIEPEDKSSLQALPQTNGASRGGQKSLSTVDLQASMEHFDWTELEARYEEKMREFENDENILLVDFSNWQRVRIN